MSAKVFSAHFKPILAIFVCMALCFGMVSCGSKRAADTEHAGDYLTEQDEEEMEYEDSLVYDIPETPLTEAVDESFLDFFYTFLQRSSFQLERVEYPIQVMDEDGEVLEVLSNGRSVRKSIHMSLDDCLVMLMGEESDPYDYISQLTDHAEIQLVDLSNRHRRCYRFDRRQGDWMFTGIDLRKHGRHSSFLKFYEQFVTDTLFRDQHLANEIFVTLPPSDEDMEDMEAIDGNIDRSQWDVFAPELPVDNIVLLSMDEEMPTETDGGMKLVKCELASSMMEVLTFEREDNDWKLIRYEE